MPSAKPARKPVSVTPRATQPPVLPQAPLRLFAGTSGWAYPTWKPGFYPAGLSAKKFLSNYSTRLNSVEVNFTFRKLPTLAQLADWLSQTPEGFRFSFKAPQRITHYSRLRDCEQHVADFLDALKPVVNAGKSGLLLFQLPPNLKANHELLDNFLALKRLRGRACPPLAFEFRHDSWFTPETSKLLSKHRTAYCISQTDDLITPEIHPSKTHTNFRLRKGGGYTAKEVEAFVDRILPLTAEQDVYVYFKHEDEPTGALNAEAFLSCAAQRGAAR